MGVVTTDATANAHAYIVTALAGPTAFAPLAATALLIRPIGVLMSALGDYERARLARAFGTDMNAHKLRNAVLLIWFTLFTGWLGSAVMTAILLTIVPHLFFPTTYTRFELVVGAVLWLIIAAVKCWRAPESIFLQATGKFKALAHASLISCWVSIVCVLVALLLCGPFGSLVGIIIGEVVFAFWITRSARIWETMRNM